MTPARHLIHFSLINQPVDAAGAGGVAAASISPLPARDPQQAHKPGLTAGKQAAGDAAGVQGAVDAAVGKLFQQHPVLGLSRVRWDLVPGKSM